MSSLIVKYKVTTMENKDTIHQSSEIKKKFKYVKLQ